MRVVWSGAGTTGGGVSTFYFNVIDMTGMPGAIGTFFSDIKVRFPSAVSWTIPGSGDTLDAETGTLTGAWTASGGTTVTGTAVGTTWAQGVGMRVTWRGVGVVNGHRPVGSTFLTSMNSTEFTGDGTPQAAAITNVQTAINTLVTTTALKMAVWTRPFPGDPLHVPPLPARDGVASPIDGGTAVDKVSWLRSRRT